MDTRTAPVFSARHVVKRYGTGDATVQALRGVDLEIRPGEFIVLLGPSGSGKSTLLNILGGLDTASRAARCASCDHDLSARRRGRAHALPARARRLRLPVLQPDPEPHRARERGAGDRHRRATRCAPEEALALVGLGERLDHFPAQLSGGEQQRVAIARAIAKRPDVLLCDEPTGALDYATGKLVLEVIAQVNRELGTTAVVITHNAAIAGMADRVIRLGDGRIVGEERTGAQAHARGDRPGEGARPQAAARPVVAARARSLTIALVVAVRHRRVRGLLLDVLVAAVVARPLLRRPRASPTSSPPPSARRTRSPTALRAIPGVAEVRDARRARRPALHRRAVDPPMVARLIGMRLRAPAGHEPAHLRSGRWPGTERGEVVVNQRFFERARPRAGGDAAGAW